MPTIVDCPTCTRKLRVTDELLGQRVKCPTCGGTFDASAPAQEAPPLEPAPPAHSAAPESTPPPLPAPDAAETVPIRLSLDDFDKPGRPPGSEATAPRPSDPMPSPRERDQPSGQRREFTRCPYCDERVSADSRRCRYCGEDLDDADEFDIRKRQVVRRDCEPHRGTLVLVLGIVSIVLRGFMVGAFIGLPAWIMGKRDLAKMDRGEMDPTGRGSTQAGYICGIIGTIIGGLELLVCVGYIAFFVVMISSTAGPKTGPAPAVKTVPVQPQPLGPPNNQPGKMK